jgi:hypothetical protein
MACHYCGTTERELRPYGPGGSSICYLCMKADPDRERAAKHAYGALLDAAGAVSPDGVVVIGSSAGPQPLVRNA